MKLPTCVFLDSKEIPGHNLVLCTEAPYNIGRPFRFENDHDLQVFLNKYKLEERCAIVADYRIILVWVGTVDDISDPVPAGNFVTVQHMQDLNKMLLFYEKERIKGNESRLKKYLR